MTEEDAYAEAVEKTAQQALARRKVRDETYAIGPVSFRISAPADSGVSWIGRAFPKASISPADEVRHTLYVWDGSDNQNRPPPAQWDNSKIQVLSGFSQDTSDAIRRAIDNDTASLVVSDFAKERSYVWYPDIGTLPPWVRASPLRLPLSWLMNRHGLQLVHAAAVGINGRAALLVGNGGAGKSTTSLACAFAGFEYLGDDYCAIEPSAGKVYMIYRTAKLLGDSLDMLPAVRTYIDSMPSGFGEKGIAFLEGESVNIARSADIAAILLPRLGDESSTIYPAARADVVKAILPSTLVGVSGGTSATPRFLMKLIQSVPAYHLPLKRDLSAVIDTVGSCVR